MVKSGLVFQYYLLFFHEQQPHTFVKTVMMMLYKQPARNDALKMKLLHLKMMVKVIWTDLVQKLKLRLVLAEKLKMEEYLVQLEEKGVVRSLGILLSEVMTEHW